jgi:Cu(I)/Ag(I) efflux system membrane fusion protein
MFILNSGASDRVRQSRTEGSPEAQQIGAATANIQQRVQQLQNLGIAAEQIDEIARTRQMPDELQIIAPAEGVIIARNVAAGQKFERGAEWYRVADLSAVWILADAFGSDVEYIRPGAEARVTLTERHRSFAARVSQVPPQFDAATRTLKVRLEAANPGFALRPDMFVDVELPVAGPTVLAVPADAVIDSGLHQVVFVERGDGVFEPRQVETGWRAADRVEIRRGLSAGERIAVAGAFFLVAESRLHPSSQPVPGAR